jgi:hypothetical protein
VSTYGGVVMQPAAWPQSTAIGAFGEKAGQFLIGFETGGDLPNLLDPNLGLS